MESRTHQTSPFLFLSFKIFFIFNLCYATDTISSGQSLKFGQTLISSGGNFELGFFNPGNSMNYYLGMWYKRVPVLENTKVWVANRDTPLYFQASSELKLMEDGNLVLSYNSVPIWSTNTASNIKNSTQVVLGDDGNLVLRNSVTPFHVLWQSFDHPTDTFLPGARIRYDKRTHTSQILTSWRTEEDPSKGEYSLEIEPIADQFVIKMNRTQTYWSSGPWNGLIFAGVPEMRLNYIFYFSYVKNANESYFTYDVYNSSLLSRLVMDLSGLIMQSTWNDQAQSWFTFWQQPEERCDVYASCGAFSVCQNSNMLPFCQCIDGFEPRDPRDWYGSNNFAGGCVRRTSLKCEDKDGFLLMSHSRLAVNQQFVEVTRESQCRLACLNDCSCNAYAYSLNCSIWKGDLLSLRRLSDNDRYGGNVYIKVAASELQTSGGNKKRWIIVGVVAAALVLALAVICIVYKKRLNRKGKIILLKEESVSTNENPKEDLELPLFDLATIVTATDHFSLSNKIGQGGFGSVYKGVLPTKEEIAIKRLSKHSRQGLQEFF